MDERKRKEQEQIGEAVVKGGMIGAIFVIICIVFALCTANNELTDPYSNGLEPTPGEKHPYTPPPSKTGESGSPNVKHIDLSSSSPTEVSIG